MDNFLLLAPDPAQRQADDFWAEPDTEEPEGRIILGRSSSSDAMLAQFLEETLWDESWQEWLAYQRDRRLILPLESVKRVLRGWVRGLEDIKPGPSVGETSNRMDYYIAREEKPPRGLISLEGGSKEDRAKKFNLVAFLTSDEGIFSGREWSWDNFLPRLLSIGGLVCLGLFITELMHYITSLGEHLANRERKGRRA